MNAISDEMLNAFLDGELPEAERARVAAALADDAEVAARFAQLAQADAALQKAWPLAAAPLTDGMNAALDQLVAARNRQTASASESTVVSLDERRKQAAAAAKQSTPPRARWQSWSLAASILVVVGAGLLYMNRQPPSAMPFALIPSTEAALPVGHPLTVTLDETASGTLREWDNAAKSKGTIYPVLSFVDQAGALCREFEIADGAAVVMGVACRRSAGWQVEALADAQGRSTTTSGYVPASGAVPAAVSAAVERLMQGEPLSADAEAQALAK
jgi:anti-sigma factor RsiW